MRSGTAASQEIDCLMVAYAAETHCGLVRSLNEDCYEADPDVGLWLVADGVGGHAGGEIASELTRATIKEVFHRTGDLRAAIEAAHAAVLDAIRRGEGSSNMGSTVVALALRGRDYEIAWVGDSRAYLWDGRLTLLTRDHSLVETLLAKGIINADQAFNHPKRNIITQSIGVTPDHALRVDSISGVLRSGQRLLLCSDGLNDEIREREIAERLAAASSLQEQVASLLQGSLTAGGRDNVTLIIVDPELERGGALESAGVAPPDPGASRAAAGQPRAAPDLDRHTLVVPAAPPATDATPRGVRGALGRLFSTKKVK